MNKGNASLRYMKMSDMDKVLAWRNSDRVRLNMTNDHVISRQEHVDWFRNLDRTKNHFLLFEYKRKPAGVVYFKDLNVDHNSCYWGFYLGDPSLPKGTGNLMGSMGLDFAFQKLGVRKICAEVFLFNDRSIKYHERLGFRREGLLKRHYLKNNHYEDIICYALFKEDWERTE